MEQVSGSWAMIYDNPWNYKLLCACATSNTVDPHLSNCRLDMLSSRIYIGWPSSIALRVYSRREIFVAYCPRQAPMGACSSNAKK